ncbi:EF-hand calcium-binding domain-containing protein 10-like [Physella acuta]|uniref:EF-hand calcium-binding domain-containing protein 10-like n=1 Tax=Physella acuta TaxID=109671 RepID=UPI0027DDBB85|nr:EF-hand calcium-binding domain-containing protein 10-like [Physella acuta]
MAAPKKQKTVLRTVEAQEYLYKHRIMDLFNNLTAQLIYKRPDNPKAFLIQTLEKLQQSRAMKGEHPCLFDESNITAVFGMLDPTGRGYITLKQYNEAMLTVGAKDFNPMPLGHEEDAINLKTFKKEAIQGLEKASATFNI